MSKIYQHPLKPKYIITDKNDNNTEQKIGLIYTNKNNPYYHKIPIIDDNQLLEGFIASSIFVWFVYIVRYQLHLSFIFYLSLPWFFTWLCRKSIPNYYMYWKHKNGYKKTYTFYW